MIRILEKKRRVSLELAWPQRRTMKLHLFLKIGKLNNNMEIVHWTTVEICTIVILSDQTSIPPLTIGDKIN